MVWRRTIVDRFDLALRTSYAHAKELALAQVTVPLTTPGSFQFQTHRGTRFIYRYRYDMRGDALANPSA
jgi:hypothetical protein